jgi:putative membrane protein
MAENPDNRNLYAAERTLLAAERSILAWSRSSLALMGFGFVIERFGLYMQMVKELSQAERLGSFWIGISFILLGSSVALLSVFRYGRILETIDEADPPKSYAIRFSKFVNLLLALLGFLLTLFLIAGFFGSG